MFILTWCMICLVLLTPNVQAEDALEEEDISDIQTQIDNILIDYGITDEMSDNEIAGAIIVADSDTFRETLDSMQKIESSAMNLSEEQLEILDIDLYGRFCGIVEQLTTPVLVKTVDVLDGKLSVTDSANSISASGNMVTATATGSLFTKKTNTITITNETENKATLELEYVATSANSFSIEGASAPTSGEYSTILEPGASVKFTIQSKNGLSDTTATLILQKIKLTEAVAGLKVTFLYDKQQGSVTVDGTTIDNNYTADSSENGLALVATPAKGYKFLGWINKDTKEVISENNEYSLKVEEDTKVEAIFVSSNSKAWFLVNNYLYDDLSIAVTKGSKVVLASDGILAAGDYTIPSGVTLLVPFDSSHTLYTTEPGTTGTTYTKPTAYRTLTMAEGAHIIVNGSISLSAKHRSGSGGKTGTGAPSGPCSFVKMESGSSITINNAGALYAYGFITGDGTILAKSGSTIYENFQVQDWRGGDGTTSLKDVFPISQYFMQNIEVPLTLETGAKEFGYTSVTVTLLGDRGTEVPFLGSSGAMFNITTGSITKKYDGTTDRLVFEVNGEMELAPATLKIGVYTISSKDYDLAINGNVSIRVKDGGSVSVQQDIALLPGTQVIIEEGATCTLGKGYNMYVYDADEWGGYCGAPGATFYSVNYAPGQKYTRTEADLVDAMIQIDGSADASQGYVYTTAGGANIFSTGNGQISLTVGTETVTYQNEKNSDTNTEIPITTAKLLNGDDSGYVNTTTATYYYNAEHKRWVAGGHTDSSSEVIAPSCTEKGYTTHICACGYKYQDSETAATGHDYSDWSQTIEPTCTVVGEETHTCTVCGSLETREVAVLGHTEIVDAGVAPTCVKTGLTEGSHCAICDEVIVAQEVIPALGGQHQYDENAKCIYCGAIATIVEKGRTLSYEDYIYVVDIFDLQNVEGIDLTQNAGIYVSTSKEKVLAHDATCVNVGLQSYSQIAGAESVAGSENFYFGVSDGIMTRELHQTLYLVGYVKLPNDQYIYSSVLEYSPSTYAYNMIEKYSATPDNNTYKLCVALLNYIAAAQQYFGSEIELVNAGLSKTERAMGTITELVTAPSISTDKQVSADKKVFTSSAQNLLFEKMISIGVIYVVDTNTINTASECYTVFWTPDQFEAIQGKPSIDNLGQGSKVPMSVYKDTEGQWVSLTPQKIAAKDMKDTVYYFMGVIKHADGTVSYSEVMSYTIETYINNKQSDGSIGTLAKRLYFYERAANAALKSTSSSN